jgi:ABC-type Fe3+-hydroxamate transport system substrate-binding protein
VSGGEPNESPTRTVTDQLGRRVVVPARPRRIVSLVPSLTELLFDLGLDAEIVGVTSFCVRPPAKVRNRGQVGGPRTFCRDLVEVLDPDLIVAARDENERERVLALADTYPVWTGDVRDLGGAVALVRQLADLVGRPARGAQLAGEIEQGFARLRPLDPPVRAGYLVWQRPFMVAGEGTLVDDLLRRGGFANAFAGLGRGRYPTVSDREIEAAGPDLLLLSSEPFPFVEEHRSALAARHPGTAVHLVDGEVFGWYGSRLLFAPAHLRRLQAMVVGAAARGSVHEASAPVQPDDLRALMVALAGRIHLEAPGARGVVFDVPGESELLAEGLHPAAVRRLLGARWWPELVAAVRRAPAFCEPAEPPKQVLRSARELVVETLRKCVPIGGD